ncbi:unnamed protein product [Haemonchus placei]|uniref:C-type lectin domain-containing protein n=1 Tax=Haemonchus placei TaxID=6290 RepID=A0A3P7Z372_HAEPC|nr:unnamed protein product [Haemonchus placei]
MISNGFTSVDYVARKDVLRVHDHSSIQTCSRSQELQCEKKVFRGLISRMPVMTSQIIISVLILTKVIVWEQSPCSPWIWNVETEKCYRKFCDKKTAEEAEKSCQKLNGHMVTICSEEENTFVAGLGLHSVPEDNILKWMWIGIKRDSSRKNWIWMSGSKCKYRHWEAREPNDLYGVEDYAHFWTANPTYHRDWADNWDE